MKSIIQQIKKTKWFFGIRREESLFFYSAKYYNREKLTKRQYGSNFVESVLFPREKHNLIRLFNLNQSKIFHSESEKKILKDPTVLEKNISKDYTLWKRIDALSNKLKNSIKQNDYNFSLKLFKKLIEKYGVYGTDFFVIFSQGMKLEQNKDNVNKSALRSLEKHNKWRNTVAFEEEKLGKVLFCFIKFLTKKTGLKVAPLQLMKYLSVREVIGFAEGRINNKQIESKVKARKQNGCAFFYLRNKKYQGIVIDDKKTTKQLTSHFSKLLKVQKAQSLNGIIGQSAFSAKNKVKGEIIVIKDKNILQKIKPNLANKILVTTQTSPHFLPYLKKVKAIITDEGGITSHAAIISREFKIPCIIGTQNATRVLKNNDMVELDLKCGTIKIL